MQRFCLLSYVIRIFQDFKLFSFSAHENIVAGDKVENFQKVQEVCESADIMNKLNSLPHQLETTVFKNYEENGIEFSGGEQQKMAIARAIYRNASILILDETTAALDPLAEYEVYKKFNEISGNKTAVFIFHSLSSCRFCDGIVVFSNGTVNTYILLVA